MQFHCRTFDLGGSGLKTLVWSCDSQTGELTNNGEEQNLARCPNRDDGGVSQWIRSRVKSLDDEIRDNWRFGFSLAGSDELFEPNGAACDLWSDRPSRNDIADLFRLPREQVHVLHDAEAHLVGCIHDAIKAGQPFEHPVFHASVGTGVGIAFTNSHKQLRHPGSLETAFQGKAWAADSLSKSASDKAVWFALGGKRAARVETRHARTRSAAEIPSPLGKFYIRSSVSLLPPHALDFAQDRMPEWRRHGLATRP
jgi:hypothetical protein